MLLLQMDVRVCGGSSGSLALISRQGHSVVGQMSTTKALFPPFRSLSGGGRNWEARGERISSSLSVLIVIPGVPSPAGARGSSGCCPARGAPAAAQLRRLS